MFGKGLWLCMEKIPGSAHSISSEKDEQQLSMVPFLGDTVNRTRDPLHIKQRFYLPCYSKKNVTLNSKGAPILVFGPK